MGGGGGKGRKPLEDSHRPPAALVGGPHVQPTSGRDPTDRDLPPSRRSLVVWHYMGQPLSNRVRREVREVYCDRASA